MCRLCERIQSLEVRLTSSIQFLLRLCVRGIAVSVDLVASSAEVGGGEKLGDSDEQVCCELRWGV